MIIIKELKDFYNHKGYTPHEHIQGFLKDKMFNDLLNNFPDNSLFKDEIPEKRKLNQRPHHRRFMCVYNTNQSSIFDSFKVELNKLPKVWQKLIEIMIDPIGEYQKWLKETLQVDDIILRFDFHRTQSGQDVSPHVDSISKYGSHLFYFMPKEWKNEFGGTTIFYKDKMVTNMNPEPNDFKEFKTYSVIGNYSLLFKNTVDGWHGVTQVKNDKELHRQLFNVVILKK